MDIRKPIGLLAVFMGGLFTTASAQDSTLTLQQALETGLHNYQSIKAKENYQKAAAANVTAIRREYLPDLSFQAQNAFGTVNGQNGPYEGYKGLTVSSSGPALASQNWNAAFGGIYAMNITWDFIQFGRQKARVNAARSEEAIYTADLALEQFQQQVRIAGAYLNLLAAQRLRKSMESNLRRAEDLKRMITARALSGLNPGVDSSIANSEVSKAQISLVDAINYEDQQQNNLARLMDVPARNFQLDSFFVSKIPADVLQQHATDLKQQPILRFYDSRIQASEAATDYIRKSMLPKITAMGIMQTRGSGFDYDYSALEPAHYSSGYWDGVHPTRTNYLLGINASWTITDWTRTRALAQRQHYTTEAYRNEYDLQYSALQHQMDLAKQQLENSMRKYEQVPFGLKASNDAYVQKSTLYENGLSDIADLAQALYNLNRAETDRDIAYNGIWQALLYEAATEGDIQTFLGQVASVGGH
ncbi:MAG TPA: TolC family protein [Chitinophaga sp.]